MANYLARHCVKQGGLTLIEVLVALAIIGIAMTAVIKASSQSIRSTSYLQEKTIAMWAAQQALNEVRVGVTKFSSEEDLQQKIHMLDRDLTILLNQEETQNKHIKKISAKVFKSDPQDSLMLPDDAEPIIVLTTFLYLQ